MGRKKNRQKRYKTEANKTLTEEIKEDVKKSCEKPEVSIDESGLETSGNNRKNEMKHDNAIALESEILFEKYRPSTERLLGREYFIHSLCHICKEEMNERILCPKCRMIGYCSHDHRKQHWPLHADLCKAIVEVCVDRETDHIMQGSVNCSADEFRVFRFQNMIDCEAKVNRTLEKWEREMLIFPNVCGTCHESNTALLLVCDLCRHSGFCKGHYAQNHKEWCELLLRYKNIIKDQSKFGIVIPSVPSSKLSLVSPKIQDIKQVFKGIMKYLDVFEFIELTEITTYPLTTLNALLKNLNQKLEKITIHVVGAEADFEIHKPEKWEYYILHMIPWLKSLEIVFIGPELRPTADQKVVSICSKCKAAEKSMTLRYQKDLYHIFSNKSIFSKPHLICVFNPGLYRTTGFNNEDTWRPSIDSMFTQDCPILLTAYTQREIDLDVQRVKQTQQIFLDQPMLNPFSSLKPNLNFVSDEESPVIFKNQYYCIMRKA